MCSCTPTAKIYGDVVMVAVDTPPLESRSLPSSLTPNTPRTPATVVVDLPDHEADRPDS